MEKGIKKLSKKSIALIVVLAMVAHYFLPLGKVFANEPQNNSYVLTFTFNANNQNTHTMVNDNGHLKIDGQFVDLKDASDNQTTIGTVACNSTNTSCTITVSDGKAGKLSYYSANKFTIFVSGHEVSFEQTITNNESYSIQDYVAPQQQEGQGGGQGQGQGNEPHFNGKAYLIWSCSNGGICFHHFDNIPNFDDGNSTFYKASEIKDERTNEAFSINATYKGWATDERFDAWVQAYKKYKNIEGNINWATVNPEDMIGNPIDMREYEDKAVDAKACTREGKTEEQFHQCVDDYVASLGTWNTRAQLQPVGEPDETNAYVSYGDRNFKVVVYNDSYKGVTIGSLEDLNYYPSEWADPFLRRDQYDLSGSTKEKPTGITTVLLEDTVNIKALSDYNGFTITSIKALDVSENAVAINLVDGEWKLVFSSNYYDNVVFEATDSNGGKTYFQIKRTTIDAWIKHDDNKPVLNADFYFDRNKSYEDFILTAKIVKKNGEERTVTLTPHKGIDDGLGNITDAYEVDQEHPKDGAAGKGLKKATFQAPLNDDEDERDIKDIYLYAEFKGSTDTNYAGSFAGSGEGVLANIYHGEEE